MEQSTVESDSECDWEPRNSKWSSKIGILYLKHNTCSMLDFGYSTSTTLYLKFWNPTSIRITLPSEGSKRHISIYRAIKKNLQYSQKTKQRESHGAMKFSKPQGSHYSADTDWTLHPFPPLRSPVGSLQDLRFNGANAARWRGGRQRDLRRSSVGL